MPLDKSPRHKAPIYIACNKCDYVVDFRVVTHYVFICTCIEKSTRTCVLCDI